MRAMMKLSLTCGVLALSLSDFCGTAWAQPARAPGEETVSVRIRGGDLRPATAAGARQLLHRIEDAALEACGAPPTSLYEVRLAARRSDCWRAAVADAVTQADAPELTALFRRERAWQERRPAPKFIAGGLGPSPRPSAAAGAPR